ncbi:MAG: HAMP domain-containing protein, partial [Lachnospiraceae bacterium]|nr:HAMP domain-containing protein [Lachnospiraceae bacterium]
MAAVKQTKRFRDELLHTLMFHAMIPFAIALLLLVAVFAGIGTYQTRAEGLALRDETGETFEKVYDDYWNVVYDLSYDLDVARFKSDTVYRSDIIRQVADFLKGQTYRGSFYVFDRDYNLLYQGGNDAYKDQLTTFLPYCTEERLGIIYAQDAAASNISAAWAIMRPVIIGDIIGYEGFVLPVSYFSSFFRQEGSHTPILSNVYGRVYSDEESPFWNQKKDLVDSVRRASGFVRMNDNWYFVTPQKVYGEHICAMVIADINSMFNLVFVVILVGIGIFAIIAFFIYRSAGRTATRHTELLYEIIDALDRVESGNFDLSLDIRSGDEFERIGESFNTMTSSIRELLRKERS